MKTDSRLSLTLGLGLLAFVFALLFWLLFHPQAIVSPYPEQQVKLTSQQTIIGDDQNTYCAAAGSREEAGCV